MSFWIAAALLTVLATALIAVPLLRAPRRGPSALDYDRELYRARLAEIDADLKLGRIDENEAEAARAEEARKLIALSGGDGASDASKAAASSGGRVSLARLALLATIVFVPVMAAGFYFFTGVPNMPDMAIASRPDRDLSRQSLTQLLENAEARLAEHPNDVRGWRVVGPVYMRIGRYEDAVTAWRNTLRLEPSDIDAKTSLAEAMTAAAGGVVTEEARNLFDEALAAQPGNPKSRFYLAIALGQQGAYAEAANAWRGMIAEAPADANWLPIARAQLAEAQKQLGVTDEAEAQQPGPTGEDIAAASQLSSEDRQTMIESMVANLAEKLKDNPDDKPGWRRLVRSYTVLGKTEEAKGALDDARKAFPDDGEFLAELEAMLGQTPAGQPATGEGAPTEADQ